VFRNILENALAVCEDPVVIEVSYSYTVLNGDAVLQIGIHDNGPGLSPEQKERIFEPFFTTKTQGTGLGMAIVKRIVDAQGGLISARNRESGGAEIVINLPLAKDRETALAVYDVIGVHENEHAVAAQDFHRR
jgi:hypothetical protein